MNNRDWEQFGNDLFKTVQEAIESCNYDRLNQTVGDAVNQVVDGVAKNVKNMANNMNQRYGEYHAPNYGQKTEKQVYVPLQKKTELIKKPSKALGILLSIFGFGTAFILTLVTILLIFASIVGGDFAVGILIFMIPVLVGLAGAAGVGLLGTALQGRVDRFTQYVKQIGNAEFCNISALASRIRKTDKFVVKDVEKMIKKGWFIQGHLDAQKTCLIVSDKVYEQYKQLEQRREILMKEDAERQRKENLTKEQLDAYRKTLSLEVQKVIEQGDAYVKKIRECNDAIPGEEISAKIDRMEMVVDRIFDRVEQHPQSVKDIRKLMEYYLPTTIKLLEAYAEMDAQPIGGENIQAAKKEIEATLDTLNVAFEKLLDGLFQEKAWDVSTDISVLNTMLAQEGLKEDGLKK